MATAMGFQRLATLVAVVVTVVVAPVVIVALG